MDMTRTVTTKLTLLAVLALIALVALPNASAGASPMAKPSAGLTTPGQLARFGWGAAATHAKAQAAHGLRSTRASLGRRARLTKAELARYGWGAGATYAKAMKPRVAAP
jgi:hypothetical protein